MGGWASSVFEQNRLQGAYNIYVYIHDFQKLHHVIPDTSYISHRNQLPVLSLLEKNIHKGITASPPACTLGSNCSCNSFGWRSINWRGDCRSLNCLPVSTPGKLAWNPKIGGFVDVSPFRKEGYFQLSCWFLGLYQQSLIPTGTSDMSFGTCLSRIKPFQIPLGIAHNPWELTKSTSTTPTNPPFRGWKLLPVLW